MKHWIARVNGNRPLLYVNIALLFVFVNLLAARANLRLDLSRDGINSLSESSEKVFSRLSDRVLIEAYISQDVPGELLAMLQPIIGILYEIEREGGDRIKFKLIDPATESEKAQAEKRGIQGIPIEEQRVDQVSARLGYFALYLQIGDKNQVISLVEEGRLVEDIEYRILREIKQMTRKSRESGIALLKAPGSLEASRWQSYNDQHKDNLFGFKSLQEKESGTIREIDLSDEVPSGIDTLIVTGLPRLERMEEYRLDQFIMRGGHVLFLLKGFDFEFRQNNPQLARLGLGGPGGGFAAVPEEDLKKLNGFLGHYGVTINGEVLLDPEVAAAARDIQGQFIMPVPNPAWAVYSKEGGQIQGKHPAIAFTEQLVLPWFSGLDLREAVQPDVKFSSLVFSNTTAIRRESTSLELRDLQNLGQENLVGRPVPLIVYASGRFKSAFAADDLPKDADREKFRAAVAGGGQVNLVFIGTPYMVSDMLVSSETNLQIYRINQAFISNLLELMAGDTDLMAARSRVQTIQQLQPLGPLTESFFRWFHILLLPLIAGLYGTYRLMGRNRKRGLT